MDGIADWQLAPEYAKILETVEKAGNRLIDVWPRDHRKRARLQAARKGDGSLVTAADMESDTLLNRAICSAFPESLFFSEETCEAIPDLSLADVWIVDPLDGTRAFWRGSPDFAIMACRYVGGAPAFSIVSFPAASETLVACSGCGVVDQSGLRLAVSKRTEAEVVRVQAAYCEIPGLVPSRRVHYRAGMLESTRAIVELVKGNLDGVVVLLCGHKIWDLVALLHLVGEAGGTVTDENGNTVAIVRGDVDAKYIVASNGYIHRSLLAALGRRRVLHWHVPIFRLRLLLSKVANMPFFAGRFI